MTAPNVAGNVNYTTVTPTPLGSNNSNPQLALSRATGPNTDGYNPGNTTGKYATYLKLFSGEVFKAYEAACIAKGTVQNRTLTNGKSMQFIFTGRMTAEYHTPGTPILGEGNPPLAEKTIVMDDLLVSSAFVYDLDETLAQYSLRSEISKKIGYSLADAYDKKIFAAAANAALQPRAVTGQNYGATIEIGYANRAGESTHSAKLVEAFFAAATRFDETNVPADGRVAVLPPQSYYNLITQVSNNLINRDEVGSGLQGGNGVYNIAGIKILKSNNLPSAAVTHTDGENNDYSHSARNFQGIHGMQEQMLRRLIL